MAQVDFSISVCVIMLRLCWFAVAMFMKLLFDCVTNIMHHTYLCLGFEADWHFVKYAWHIEGSLPKGPYPPCLRMADRALLAGYPWYQVVRHTSQTHVAYVIIDLSVLASLFSYVVMRRIYQGIKSKSVDECHCPNCNRKRWECVNIHLNVHCWSLESLCWGLSVFSSCPP